MYITPQNREKDFYFDLQVVDFITLSRLVLYSTNREKDFYFDLQVVDFIALSRLVLYSTRQGKGLLL